MELGDGVLGRWDSGNEIRRRLRTNSLSLSLVRRSSRRRGTNAVPTRPDGDLARLFDLRALVC